VVGVRLAILQTLPDGVRPAILAILLMPYNDSGLKRSRNSELQESQA